MSSRATDVPEAPPVLRRQWPSRPLRDGNDIVTSSGDVIPIPQGARGPLPAQNGRGFRYVGGSGGHGLDSRVAEVRIMAPVPPRGPSPGYPGGYVTYSNAVGQSVNPYTGRTIAQADPAWHIPIQLHLSSNR